MSEHHSTETCTSSLPTLDAPAEYFPLQNGKYKISPGLSRLGTDFGNGTADTRIFQLDCNYHRYRDIKLTARSERFDKYVCEAEPAPETLSALNLFIIRQLNKEYPSSFLLQRGPAEEYFLNCRLSNETLCFSPEGALLDHATPPANSPGYHSALDALACQVQEDLALMEWHDTRGDQLTALHLCFPNHWSAEDKIGKNFNAIHAPVPDFDRIAAQSKRLIRSMISKGAFVRFAWGIATDTQLNHHPGMSTGRKFQPDTPQLYLRVERQTMTSLVGVNAALFTIRTYFIDVQNLKNKPHKLAQVRSALVSMNQDTLVYKGLAGDRPAILEWLDRLLSAARKL